MKTEVQFSVEYDQKSNLRLQSCPNQCPKVWRLKKSQMASLAENELQGPLLAHSGGISAWVAHSFGTFGGVVQTPGFGQA